MTYERRPYLPAVVSPLAALVLSGDLASVIEPYLRSMELSPIERNREAARQIRQAQASMRESARQLRQRGEVGSAGGTAEPAPVVEVAESGVSSSWDHLTVVQVAGRLQVSSEYVRRLCRTGGLSATRSGRDWAIDAESVAAYELSRRRVG